MAPLELTAPSTLPTRLLTCWVLLLAAVVGAAAMFPRLGVNRLENDEAVYALVTDQMLRTGEFISSSAFPPEPYLNKPPLYMWLSAATYRWLPGLEFKYRFWSALFGTIAVVATAGLGAKLFRPEVGLLAAGLLAGNRAFLFNHGARFGGLDAGLTACFAVLLLVHWIGRKGRWRPLPWAVTLGLIAGTASLFKPLAGVPMLLLIGLHSALAAGASRIKEGHEPGHFSKQWKSRKVQPVPSSAVGRLFPGESGDAADTSKTVFVESRWRGAILPAVVSLLLCLVIALPWYVVQYARLGHDTIFELYQRELANRVTGVGSPEWNKPWHYYLSAIPSASSLFILTVPALLWLAAYLLAAAFAKMNSQSVAESSEAPAVERLRPTSAIGLLLIVIVAWVGGLSFSSGKFLHYAFPAFPALSIGCGVTLVWLADWIGAWLADRFSPSQTSVSRAFARWGVAWATLGYAIYGAGVVVPKVGEPAYIWRLYQTFEPAILDRRMDLLFCGVPHRADKASAREATKPSSVFYLSRMQGVQQVSTPTELSARLATGKPALVICRPDQEWALIPELHPGSGVYDPLFSDNRPPISIFAVHLDRLLKVRWRPGATEPNSPISVVAPSTAMAATQSASQVVAFRSELKLHVTPPLLEAVRLTISLQPPPGQPARVFHWRVSSEGDEFKASDVKFSGPMNIDLSLGRLSTEKHRTRTVTITLEPADGQGPVLGELTGILLQILPEVVPGRDGRDVK